MEGKEAIINKIIEDAETLAKEKIAAAENKAKEVKTAAEEWAENYASVQTDILSKEQKSVIDGKATLAQLDCRKIMLYEKQKIISEVLDKLYLKLCGLNKKEYIAFVEKLLNSAADNGDEIILSSDGVIKAEDVKKLKVYKDKNLTLSEKSGKFVGGVYLNGKVSDKDLTFKSVLQDKKDQLIFEVAEEIFDD